MGEWESGGMGEWGNGAPARPAPRTAPARVPECRPQPAGHLVRRPARLQGQHPHVCRSAGLSRRGVWCAGPPGSKDSTRACAGVPASAGGASGAPARPAPRTAPARVPECRPQPAGHLVRRPARLQGQHPHVCRSAGANRLRQCARGSARAMGQAGWHRRSGHTRHGMGWVRGASTSATLYAGTPDAGEFHSRDNRCHAPAQCPAERRTTCRPVHR